MRWIAVMLVVASVSGCGSRGDSNQDDGYNAVQMPAADASPSPVAEAFPTPSPPPSPSHNYDDREGLVYNYVAAVSEDDRKKGQAAGDVISFAYMGVRNGKHVLARIGRDDRILSYAACPKPCRVIIYGDGSKVGYNESSIIGAAFADALAGRLEVAEEDRPTPKQPQAERPQQQAEGTPPDGWTYGGDEPPAAPTAASAMETESVGLPPSP